MVPVKVVLALTTIISSTVAIIFGPPAKECRSYRDCKQFQRTSARTQCRSYGDQRKFRATSACAEFESDVFISWGKAGLPAPHPDFLPAASATECSRLCENQPLCQAWNFNANFGCNLKQAAVGRRRYSGWVSGLRGGCPAINPAPVNPGTSCGGTYFLPGKCKRVRDGWCRIGNFFGIRNRCNDGSRCAECLADQDCSSREFGKRNRCNAASQCTECLEDQDCSSRKFGKRNRCDAKKRRCLECVDDQDCSSGEMCGVDSTCRQVDRRGTSCYVDSSCGKGIRCISGFCDGCSSNSDCKYPQKCFNDYCVDECYFDSDCDGSKKCVERKCIGCSSHFDCDGSRTCDNGICG